MSQRLSRKQLEDHIWNICMRVGSFEGKNISALKHGKSNAPMALPFKLIMLINQNFNDLLEANHFFSPVLKEQHYPHFLDMLNNIAPFKETDILFEGAIFSVISRTPVPIYTQVYRD